MKTWTKTTIAASLIAVTALGAGTALARGGDCGGFGPGGKGGWQAASAEQMQQRIAQRVDLQLARLELALALTPQQQGAWNAFKTAMGERAQKMAATMGEGREAGAPATAVERLQRMEAMSAARQTEMAETRRAVERFYGTLSDAQKKVFDADFAALGGHGPRGMGPGREGGPREGGRGAGRG